MQYKDIAIIGMSMRLPQANDADSLHTNLSAKKDCVREVPESRMELLKLDKNVHYLEVGYIDDIEFFDHSFFNISSMEADVMCIEQRFSLEMAAEAILDAGYSLESFRGTNCCVYYSSTENEYKLLAGQNSAAAYTGNLKSLTAGKICYYLDLRGPNVTVDSACSSSLVGMHEACMKIVSGECDYALIGGFSVNIYIPCFNDNDFNNLGVISGGGRSYSFDARAQGTGMGEGGGFVLLKALDKALEDHDHIYGVVKGSAINCDGFRGSSLTAPSASGQKDAILEAWKRGNVSGTDITEFEAHGTGTLIGDPIEAEGIESSLEEFPDNGEKVYLSAFKSSIGHLAAAAGIAAVLKCVVQFEKGVTYPISNFEKPNPYIDFDNMRLQPLQEVKHWDSKKRRLVGINSFGFSGTNAHVVMENYTENQVKNADDTPLLVKVSAKNPDSLRQMADKIAVFLRENQDNAGNILYTLNTGRDDYAYRICVTGNTPEELADALQKTEPSASETRKTALVLTQPEHLTEELLSKQIAEFKFLKKAGFVYDYLLADAYGKYLVAQAEQEQTENLAEKAAEFASAYENKTENAVKTLLSLKENEKITAVFFNQTETDLQTDENCHVLNRGQNNAAGLIAEWYQDGGQVQWENLYPAKEYFRASAPTYVFSKNKHWIYPKHKFSMLGIVDGIEDAEEKKETITDRETFKAELLTLWQDVLEQDITDEDDFFDCGGNSLNGMMMIEKVQERWGISVAFDDVYDYATVNEFCDFLMEQQKSDAPAETESATQETTVSASSPAEEEYKLGSAQKMIYQTIKEYPANSGWNLCMSIGMEGKVNHARLENAIGRMISANDSYRTVFLEKDDDIYQKVLETYEFHLPVVKAQGSTYDEKYQWCKDEINRLANISILMANQVPLDIRLFEVSETYAILYIGVSHVIADGSSLSLMLGQINQYYLGKDFPVDYQFYDYCKWQREFPDTAKGRQQKAFWEQYLSGLELNTHYEYEKTDTPLQDAVGKLIVFPVSEELYQAINSVCRSRKITPYIYTLLAFHILVARYTGHKDVFCLSVTANRRENAFKAVSGCLADCIILRSNMTENKNLTDQLHILSEDVKNALENQEYPMYQLLWELTGKEPRLMENWGEFFMAFQNYKSEDLSLEDLKLRAENISKNGCMAKLQLAISENSNGMYGIFQYNESNFTQATVERLKDEYLELLRKMAENPDNFIDTLLS